MGNVGRRTASVVATMLAMVGFSSSASAFKFGSPPTAVFAGGPSSSTLQQLSLTVFQSGANGPPGISLPIQLQYRDPDGFPLGGPLAATLPASGALQIPPAPFPSGAAALGSQLEVSGTGEPSTPAVAWYQGTWSWVSTQIGLRCHSAGIDCESLTVTSHWFMDGQPVITGTDAVFGARTLTVVDSGFDLIWSTHLDVLTATVVGDNSFIALSDGTRIALPSGEVFGQRGPQPFELTFTPVGLSGPIPIVHSGGDDTISCAPVGSFSGPALSVIAPPSQPAAVPAIPRSLAVALSVALLTVGLSRLWRARRLARSSGHR